MKRIISLFFVLIMILSIFCASVSAIVPHSTVDELGLVDDIEVIETVDVDVFEYYYKNKKTFEFLESVLIEYNKEFGYQTEKEIRIGSGNEEFTAAIFDEKKIIIYCSFIEESPIKEKVKVKSITYFVEEVIELSDEYYIRPFVSEISGVSTYLSSIMLPMIFSNYTTISSERLFLLGLIDILNEVFGYISLGYLIYVIIYLIYSKIKKKELKNIKIKIVLSLLSFLYILFGGLTGIISWILSMATLI